MQGGSGISLSYVTREINKLHPKPSVDNPVTAYTTHNEDMVKRALIIVEGNKLGAEEDTPFKNSFLTDRGKVWDLIYPLIIRTEVWPHIKLARTSHDGRKAMLEFHDPFLGPKNVDHIQKQAEHKLLSLSYQR